MHSAKHPKLGLRFNCMQIKTWLVTFEQLIWPVSASLFIQIQTVTKKVEVVVEEVNTTAMEGLVANITKEPQYVIKKSLQFKSGMNVLGV